MISQPTPPIDKDEERNKLLGRICDYMMLIHGLIGFAHEVCWDPDSKCRHPGSVFSLGDRVTVRPPDDEVDQKIGKRPPLTPDLLVKRGPYLVVGEGKRSLPKMDKEPHPSGGADDKRPSKDEAWAREVADLSKYDCQMSDWPENGAVLSEHDLVLLVPYFFGKKLAKVIQREQAKGRLLFDRPFALVSFHEPSRTSTVDDTLALDLVFGELSDPQLSERLSGVQHIKMEYLTAYLSTKAFSDVEPEKPYMMAKLWELLGEWDDGNEIEQYVSRRDSDGTPILRISLSDVLRTLQERQAAPFGLSPHCRTLPRRKWLEEALVELERHKYAKRVDADQFEIAYKPLDDPLGTFIDKVIGREVAHKAKPKRSRRAGGAAKAGAGQLRLPF